MGGKDREALFSLPWLCISPMEICGYSDLPQAKNEFDSKRALHVQRFNLLSSASDSAHPHEFPALTCNVNF
jgi:hypothetical protein